MLTEKMPMDRGIIKFFNKDRGFGFIAPVAGGNADVFFHISRCAGFIPTDGDPVEYIIERDSDGRFRAKTVRSALRAAAE